LRHPQSTPSSTTEGLIAEVERFVDLYLARRRHIPEDHCCNDGWVTLGQVVVDPETGEESVEDALYLCRRCSEEAEDA
jgi:hypothetical protein